ncbi:hypothetical protein JRQ81_009729, partial [Phrynocephalus forsythii]
VCYPEIQKEKYHLLLTAARWLHQSSSQINEKNILQYIQGLLGFSCSRPCSLHLSENEQSASQSGTELFGFGYPKFKSKV